MWTGTGQSEIVAAMLDFRSAQKSQISDMTIISSSMHNIIPVCEIVSKKNLFMYFTEAPMLNYDLWWRPSYILNRHQNHKFYVGP